MIQRKGLLAFLLLTAATHQPSAFANVGKAYGFGSRNSALGRSTSSWGFDGYSAYLNPAGLSLAAPIDRRFVMSYGFLVMEPSFLPISRVVTENGYVSDKTTPVTGDVDTSYNSTSGQLIGASFNTLPGDWNLTVGLTAYVPLNQIAYIDSGETYIPEYVLYRAQTQLPQVDLGIGTDLSRYFHLGVGYHIAFTLTSNATVYIRTNSAKPSTMRFTASMKPKGSPFFGFLLTPFEKQDRFSLSAILRFATTSDNTLALKSSAQVFGSLPALDFKFNALSAISYDPMTLELGASFLEGPFRTYAQLDYEYWSKFQAPALIIEGNNGVTSCPDPSTCGTLVSSGPTLPYPYRDILTPRVGEEITWGDTVLRLGYAYRQSIFSLLPSGAGNYLDPPKHILAVGTGFQFHRFFGFKIPCSLDLHFSYHQLITQHVTKTPGDETDTGTGDLKIGAPGYDAGGKIYGGGVSLTLAL